MARERIQQKSVQNKKHRTSFFRRCFVWCIIFVILFVGVGLLARISSLQVDSGMYENIVVTNTEDVDTVIQKHIHSRFLYPRSNVVWFSERLLEKKIMQEFPRLSFVDVSIVPKKKIKVWAKEREGAFLWCGNTLEDISVHTTHCFFADDQGFIFDTSPFFSGTSFVRFFGGVTDENPIQKTVTSPEVLGLYQSFTKSLSEFGFKIQAVWTKEDNQIEFILLSNQPLTRAPKIKYYIEGDIDSAISNLANALGDQEVYLDIQKNYDRLEYIDIRFEDQFIYKFFDVVSEQSVQEVVEQEYVEEVSEEIIEEEPEVEVEESTEG